MSLLKNALFQTTLFKIDKNPSSKTLRQFAAASCVALPLLGWTFGETIGLGCGVVVAKLMVAAAVARPQSLRLPFLGLSYATAPLGLVVGEILAVLMYFAVFAPIGLLLRATGRDPLARRFEPESKSYWTPKRRAPSGASYLRQF
jgi:hypothetical protein